MIRIDKPEPDDPAWKAWRAAADAERAAMAPDVKPAIKEALYKEQKAALLDLFNGKCAFCETPIGPGMHGDVEHFRPKGAVTEEDGSKAKYVDDQGEEREHPGYYWLAYDWRNLLLSCQLCNQPSAGGGGKRNYFPLRNPADRAHQPDDEEREEPLFIHPWFEDPAKHFAFDETGAIIPLTDKAEKCVERLVLNRDALITARRETYEVACDKVYALAGKSPEDATSIERLQGDLRDWMKGRRAYSAPARVAIAKTKAHILELLGLLEGTA
jgi:uncharacterized protein (TIGR02646 family)